MIKNSLNEIISDIYQIYFNSKPSDENQLSRNEVEFWIHQYRAMLIKQDLDKGRDINESYMQTLPALKLVSVDYGADGGIETGINRYITEEKIPSLLDLHYKLPLIVYTLTDDEIQLMPESRASWQRYRKYTSEAARAYYTNNHIYIEGCDLLEYIKVKGVFNNPVEVITMFGDCFDADSEYPIPSNMVPVLRQMILQRELGIMQQQGSDVVNNANDEQRVTVEQQQQRRRK
jgi:hypothetical protein